jgi:hypothetical protein
MFESASSSLEGGVLTFILFLIIFAYGIYKEHKQGKEIQNPFKSWDELKPW